MISKSTVSLCCVLYALYLDPTKPFRKSKQIEDLLIETNHKVICRFTKTFGFCRTHKNSKNFCREIWIPKSDTSSLREEIYLSWRISIKPSLLLPNLLENRDKSKICRVIWGSNTFYKGVGCEQLIILHHIQEEHFWRSFFNYFWKYVYIVL